MQKFKSKQQCLLTENNLQKCPTNVFCKDEVKNNKNNNRHCRGQTTVQSCIGGHINVLSDYKKMRLQKKFFF